VVGVRRSTTLKASTLAITPQMWWVLRGSTTLKASTLAITPQMWWVLESHYTTDVWWVLEKHRSNTLLHFNFNHIVFFTEDQYLYKVFYFLYLYKTLTSHNGNSIPLKKAAGLNKDFLTA
jgi:hypothetical protein